MSVADRLGTGSSFSERRGRSARGRAKAVTQGDVPVYELVRLRLDEVSPTPSTRAATSAPTKTRHASARNCATRSWPHVSP